MFERRRCLADQHGEPVDGPEPGGAGILQEWRSDRIGNDIIGDRTRRRMAPVEGEGGLAAHAERRGVDDQVAASLAIIEGEIGRLREMVERRDMVFAVGIEFLQQRARLVSIATGKHDAKPFARQSGHDRARGTASAQHARHAEIVLLAKPLRQRLEKPGHIGIASDQAAVGGLHDRIDRTDALRQRFEPVEHRHDGLFVRHGDIASAPGGVLAAHGEIVLQPRSFDTRGTVFRIEPELLDPQPVDDGRFRLGDRIADHFDIGGHEASTPSPRSASRTWSRGMPSTVNWSPAMLSNNCTPGPSIRNTPTQ